MEHQHTAPTTLVKLCGTLIGLSTIFGALGGCQQQSMTRGIAASDQELDIRLDGDTREWPADAAAYADEHYLYLRFTVQADQFTLQAAPRSVAIMLDVDGSTSTGEVSDLEPFDTLGIDLELQFSPRHGGGNGRGAALYAIDASGKRTAISAADFEITAAPTFASAWYEVRICRTPSSNGGLPAAGLLGTGMLRGSVVTLDESGEIDGFSDPFSCKLDAVCPGGRRQVNLAPPAKAPGTIRVINYNVLASGPAKNPQVFQRIFEVLQPDVVLVQEWEEGDAETLKGWFTALVGTSTQWHAVKAPGDRSNGGGVGIVSRWPLTQLPDAVTMTSERGGPRPVRFVGAKAQSPYGELLLGATHLKCCGTKDSAEDRTRMAEARAINAYFAKAGAASPRAIRIIAGDLNLVGSRPPLDLLRAKADADGTDMTVAEPMAWGDVTLTTWREAKSEFMPGRLDYIIYSDSNAEAVNAFTFDTATLTDEALAMMGLDRTDSTASDHLPVVVDLRPIRK